MLRNLGLCWLILALFGGVSLAAERPPNFVLIYCDDLGYGDLGCYGSKTNSTPNLDRLAAQGLRFTDFHTAAAVCSASRAALLTGCYPLRVEIMGALGPQSKVGIHADEILLPELLKKQGYATAIYGKWHLGHLPMFLPMQHGFDDYFGLPYSNDMWPFHPQGKFTALPLIEKNETVNLNPDQTKLTRWYTERAVKFIEEKKDQPFFLYVPHSMPHVPLFVGYDYYGKTGRGIYADVLAEIDASVGSILAALEKHHLTENTVVVFSSDNGPWLTYGQHAGSSGGFREGKGTTFEGGMRVPMLAAWPGKIPAGKTCDALCGTIDILPTFAALAGTKAPEDRLIDGRDLRPILFEEANAPPPRDTYLYYWNYGLDAVRYQHWKLHYPHTFPSLTGKPGEHGVPGGITQGKIGKALFNLKEDPSESRNVLEQHPEIVAQLDQIAQAAREDLGNSHQKVNGKNRRPAGKAE
jgi:arylsulfatase A-like enzyme